MQLKVFSRQSHAFAWLCAYFLDWLSLAFGIRLVKLLGLRPARKSALAAALFHIVGTYLYKVCALTHTHTHTQPNTRSLAQSSRLTTLRHAETQNTQPHVQTHTHAYLEWSVLVCAHMHMKTAFVSVSRNNLKMAHDMASAALPVPIVVAVVVPAAAAAIR